VNNKPSLPTTEIAPRGQVFGDRQQAARSMFSAQPSMCVNVSLCSSSTHGGVVRDVPYLPLLLSYFWGSFRPEKWAWQGQKATPKMHGQPLQPIPRTGWVKAARKLCCRAGQPSRQHRQGCTLASLASALAVVG